MTMEITGVCFGRVGVGGGRWGGGCGLMGVHICVFVCECWCQCPLAECGLAPC